jgi:hypothetical protein
VRSRQQQTAAFTRARLASSTCPLVAEPLLLSSGHTMVSIAATISALQRLGRHRADASAWCDALDQLRRLLGQRQLGRESRTACRDGCCRPFHDAAP